MVGGFFIFFFKSFLFFRFLNFQAWFRSHSIGAGAYLIEIRNKDEKCFPRAVAIAIAEKRKNDSKEANNHFDYLRRGRKIKNKSEDEMANEILRLAGLTDHAGACGPQEWRAIEDSLDARYGLRIWAKNYCRGILYEGRAASEYLHLFLYDEHFAVITKITAYLNRSYVCHSCLSGYNTLGEHNCENICRQCSQVGHCASEGKRIYCSKCNNWFSSQRCFENHQLNFKKVAEGAKRRKTNTACDERKRCTKCQHIIYRKGKHICFKFKCSVCKLDVINEKEHQFNCYMQPQKKIEVASETTEKEGDISEKSSDDNEKKSVSSKKFEKSFVFFDFESCQTRLHSTDKNEKAIFAHDPNYCVVQKVCDICKDDNEIW